MTKTRRLHSASSALLCPIHLAAAGFSLTSLQRVPDVSTAFGIPAFLVPLPIAARITAPRAVLTRISVRLRDLAHAGLSDDLLLAVSAQLDAGGDGHIPALAALALMLTSFLSQNTARKRPSPNTPRRVERRS